MRRTLVILAAMAGVIGVSVFWVVTIPAMVASSSLSPHTPNLQVGKTMFHIGGCASCHAVPGDKERVRLGGGRALKSPFGTFYAPNISPDPRDGIGAWSEAAFVTAMVEGTSPDGRHYYPAFPYTSYRNIRPDDLRDLFAYLKTLPPVSGKAPDHNLVFPVNIRRALGIWKLLFHRAAPIKPDSSQSELWNRGAYLVNGPGHCAECHSPRGALGAIISEQRLAGGPNPEGKGWVPNITQKGLKDWSEKDVAYLLETGETPDGDSVGSLMTEVVRNTAEIGPEDRAAIAAYIKSLPPVEGPPKPEKKK